jgi:hypothetical protein
MIEATHTTAIVIHSVINTFSRRRTNFFCGGVASCISTKSPNNQYTTGGSYIETSEQIPNERGMVYKGHSLEASCAGYAANPARLAQLILRQPRMASVSCVLSKNCQHQRQNQASNVTGDGLAPSDISCAPESNHLRGLVAARRRCWGKGFF